jgi:hypothetical protein
MKHTQDNSPHETDTESLAPKRVWGYEGCGAMWTFYSVREQAIESAIDSRVYELEVYEAFLLDNTRRHEMGYPPITFEQFLDCVNHPIHCVTEAMECME